MREIKFRAWDKNKKKMIKHFGYGKDYMVGGKGLTLNELIEAEIAHGMILMQYTGLKDRKEKEICEGDIVKVISRYPVNTYYNKKNDLFNEIFIIVKLDCGLCARHSESYIKNKKNFFEQSPNVVCNGWEIIKPYNLWNYQRWLKVIGNIYDNPKLLNSK